MAERPVLTIKDLRVSVDGKPIVKGLDLEVKGGEIHALMGPNGSGKTTLSKAIAGHPRYTIDGGEVLLNGVNLLELSPDERARAGLFLAFQYPVEVPGVTVANFLRTALQAIRGEEIGVWEFQELLAEKMKLLEMDESFAGRYLNEGFSGGEKKRSEMLQMALLQPKIAILDETDSGLDVDALKVVGKTVNSMRGENFGALIITHYNRILKHIRPDVVHIMVDGRIIRTGGPELADLVEEKGYDWIRSQVA
ncbi:MAG: Fe-S cluster assembly ATPase SufC [Bacillota bacterium]